METPTKKKLNYPKKDKQKIPFIPFLCGIVILNFLLKKKKNTEFFY